MIAVIQRCKSASVEIEGKIHNEIGNGLLVLLGIKKGDDESNTDKLSQKILDLRIFDDDKGVMNLSVKDIKGELLIISQFTLCADNGKSGNRPSYINAEVPEKSDPMYQYFLKHSRENYAEDKVKDGVFGADMQVKLINDGPVTIILDK
ncbi:MAG: D-aminoacyl-tRNA deacylase [Ignavibacteriae bacterium]|nr:D-aminoacyl-tRNA deacylase [Ignavibacteriota bacterium]